MKSKKHIHSTAHTLSMYLNTNNQSFRSFETPRTSDLKIIQPSSYFKALSTFENFTIHPELNAIIHIFILPFNKFPSPSFVWFLFTQMMPFLLNW